MLTRRHSPSALLMVLPMLALETKRFGFEGVDLGWVQLKNTIGPAGTLGGVISGHVIIKEMLIN